MGTDNLLYNEYVLSKALLTYNEQIIFFMYEPNKYFVPTLSSDISGNFFGSRPSVVLSLSLCTC